MPDDSRTRLVTELFDEMRAEGKTDREIFAEAASALKQLARKMTAREPPGASMCASRLLNDLYVKLFDRPGSDFQWGTGEEFFSAVTKAMHNLKRDHFRKAHGVTRGGGKVGSLDGLRDQGVEVAAAQQSPSAGWAGSSSPINKNSSEEHIFDELCQHSDSIDRAMARLWEEFPERARVIALTYWGRDGDEDGLSRQEVAEIMNKSPHTINKDLQKGRARLRHYLSI